MTQETKEWYDMAVMDLGVARHLDETYYPKPLEDHLLSLSTICREGH